MTTVDRIQGRGIQKRGFAQCGASAWRSPLEIQGPCKFFHISG